jgi:hypothetical protein
MKVTVIDACIFTFTWLSSWLIRGGSGRMMPR